jgi:hypothetical protein
MDLTPIFEATVILIAAVVTMVIVPYIKSRTTAGQQHQINAWVKTAVVAAEQIFSEKGRGSEKKAYVLNFLAAHGIKLEEERLNALIEATVYSLKNGIIPTE